MNQNKSFWQIVKELSIIIGIGVVGIIIVNYTTDIFRQPKVIEKTIVVEENPDYNSLTGMKSIPLVEIFDSYTPDKKPTAKYENRGVILKNGKISKGYLEIVASIDGKPLTSWESIYFKAPYNVVNHSQYGGHIFRPESLKVPLSEKTHLLFALNNIPFLQGSYSEFAEPSHFDLFKIINENQEVKYLSFISSLVPAKIDLIKIYYECDKDFNNGNCELSLEK